MLNTILLVVSVPDAYALGTLVLLYKLELHRYKVYRWLGMVLMLFNNDH